jgi:hypothetical protein
MGATLSGERMVDQVHTVTHSLSWELLRSYPGWVIVEMTATGMVEVGTIFCQATYMFEGQDPLLSWWARVV